MRVGPDGRLWAINPEAGFFGVVPGTEHEDQPERPADDPDTNTIFTNVAVDRTATPWWEGMDDDAAGRRDRLEGQALDARQRQQGRAPQLALHRPGAPVPVHLAELGRSAGRADLGDHLRRPPRPRRAAGLPVLRLEARRLRRRDDGAPRRPPPPPARVGVVRRDPMAMLPFCGYNMGDYFAHWLRHGQAGSTQAAEDLPRQLVPAGRRGRFLWPGFGENLRVLKWIDRAHPGPRRRPRETPIGLVPTADALNLDGLDLPKADLDTLLSVNKDEWAAEVPEIRAFFDKFGTKLPRERTSRSILWASAWAPPRRSRPSRPPAGARAGAGPASFPRPRRPAPQERTSPAPWARPWVRSTRGGPMSTTTPARRKTPTAPDANLPRILQEGHGPGAWHGSDLKAALADVSPELAFWRAAPGRPDIAEIALHHACCARSVGAQLSGQPAEAFVTEGEDWFALSQGQGLSWKEVQAAVKRGTAPVDQRRGRPERRSGQSPLTATPCFGLVLGVACHAIPHAGQVQLPRTSCRPGSRVRLRLQPSSAPSGVARTGAPTRARKREGGRPSSRRKEFVKSWLWSA